MHGRKVMGAVCNYLAAIKQVKGIVEAIQRILPLLSIVFGPGSAKLNVIPIDTSLRAPAGGLASFLSAFAFIFIFAKDYERLRVGQDTKSRSVTGALGYIGGAIGFFFGYWILRSYFGTNPSFISQGFTEGIILILYALIFAFFTAGLTLPALKLYLDKERISKGGQLAK